MNELIFKIIYSLVNWEANPSIAWLSTMFAMANGLQWCQSRTEWEAVENKNKMIECNFENYWWFRFVIVTSWRVVVILTMIAIERKPQWNQQHCSLYIVDFDDWNVIQLPRQWLRYSKLHGPFWLQNKYADSLVSKRVRKWTFSFSFLWVNGKF